MNANECMKLPREAESIAKLLVHVRPWYGADDTDSDFDPYDWRQYIYCRRVSYMSNPIGCNITSAVTSTMMRYLQAVTY
jgi:hypothetical protein